jgi:hypothetical protein
MLSSCRSEEVSSTESPLQGSYAEILPTVSEEESQLATEGVILPSSNEEVSQPVAEAVISPSPNEEVSQPAVKGVIDGCSSVTPSSVGEEMEDTLEGVWGKYPSREDINFLERWKTQSDKVLAATESIPAGSTATTGSWRSPVW